MTNYLEIYKACRLCGSGGGYKMPIIQKIDDNDVVDVEAELKQKIKECVSIEVQSDDRMPPLICELCVDKVNDFYEFREMCKATNNRVRSSLGLPPQLSYQDTTEDCILGVTGPVFHSSKEPDPVLIRKPGPASRSRKDKSLSNLKKSLAAAPIVVLPEKRRHSAIKPQPLLMERSRRRKAENNSPSPISKKLRFSSPSPSPSVTSNRSDRRRSLDKSKSVDVKKTAKETLRDVPKAKDILKMETRRSKDVVSEPKREKKYANPCEICPTGFTKPQLLRQHQSSSHLPQVLTERLGCAPCREWFLSVRDADAHHKWHKTSGTFYCCHRCSADFKVLLGYTKHLQLKQCIPEVVVPDVTCSECLKPFATQSWMNQHKCPGLPPPPRSCSRCKKTFSKVISLRRHEKTCKVVVSHVELNPNNPYLQALRSVEVRMPRCDNLLLRVKREPEEVPAFDLGNVKTEPIEPTYEDTNCYIKEEVKEELPDYSYNDDDFAGNYESDDNSNTSEPETSQTPNLVLNPFARKNTMQVESLSVISLRSIFSDKTFKKKSKPKKKKPKLEPFITSMKPDPSDSVLHSEEQTSKGIRVADFEDCGDHLFPGNVNINAENGEVFINQLSRNVEDELQGNTHPGSSSEWNLESQNDNIQNTKTTDLVLVENSLISANVREESEQNVSCEIRNDSDNNNSDSTEHDGRKFENCDYDVESIEKQININMEAADKVNTEKQIDENVNSACHDHQQTIDINKECEGALAELENGEAMHTDLRVCDIGNEEDEKSEKVVPYDSKGDGSGVHTLSPDNINKEDGVKSLSDIVLEEIKEPKTVSTENTDDCILDEPKGKSVEDVLLSDNVEYSSDLNSQLNTVSDDVDIDFDVDSVFRGELNPEALKKKNIIISTQPLVDRSSENSIVPQKTANMDTLSVDTGDFVNSSSCDANVSVGINSEQTISKQEVIQETMENDFEKEKKIDREFIGRSESDVMDLISDSGDDCNIVDSPGKTKALEEQLPGEEENKSTDVANNVMEFRNFNIKKFGDGLLDGMGEIKKVQENISRDNSCQDDYMRHHLEVQEKYSNMENIQKNCTADDFSSQVQDQTSVYDLKKAQENNATEKLNDPSCMEHRSVDIRKSDDSGRGLFKDTQMSEGGVKNKGECKELCGVPSSMDTLQDLDAVSDEEFEMDL